MTYFRTALGAIFSVLVSLAIASPASATALYNGTVTSITVGNLLISNTVCTASGTASCTTTTWGIAAAPFAGAGPGSLSISLTPQNSTIWTGGRNNDLNLTFEIQSLAPNGTPSSALNFINGVGMTASGSGSIAQGFNVSSPYNALSVGGLGTLNGNPTSPSNGVSFAPQSAIFVNFDMGPLTAGSTITGVNLFVSHAPEPATFGLLLIGGMALAGVRRRDLSTFGRG